MVSSHQIFNCYLADLKDFPFTSKLCKLSKANCGMCDNQCVHQFSLVQSLSCVRLSATPWIAAHQAFLSITNSQSSLKLTSIESVMPSSHLILCHPLFHRWPHSGLLKLLPTTSHWNVPLLMEAKTLCLGSLWGFTFSVLTYSKLHCIKPWWVPNCLVQTFTKGDNGHLCSHLFRTTDLIAQLVKNPPAIQETPVQLLGQEDPLENG